MRRAASARRARASSVMRRDRARTKILRTSPFGLIEMTRQRIRPSVKRSVYGDCPCCGGRGVVKTSESMAIEVVRLIMLASHQAGISRVTVQVNQEVATYLNNRKRREITKLEDELKEIRKFIKECKEILASKPRRLKILKEELAELE